MRSLCHEVIWSFVLKVPAILIPRFKDKTPREWKVPFNIKIKGIELPVGLALIFLFLFALAFANLLTKQVATLSGIAFTFIFFSVFSLSERINSRKRKLQTAHRGHIDRVNLTQMDTLNPKDCGCSKPRRIIIAVRDPHNLAHIGKVLSKMNQTSTDVVVMTSKIATGLHLEGNLSELSPEDEILFTKIISEAEKIGCPVIPIYVPSNDPYYAMARVACDLEAEELVVGKSGKYSPEIQMENIALAWDAVRGKSRRPLKIRIIWAGSEFKEDLI